MIDAAPQADPPVIPNRLEVRMAGRSGVALPETVGHEAPVNLVVVVAPRGAVEEGLNATDLQAPGHGPIVYRARRTVSHIVIPAPCG